MRTWVSLVMLVFVVILTACSWRPNLVEQGHDRGAPMKPEDSSVVYQLQNYTGGKLDEIAAGGFDVAIVDLARDAGSSYFTAAEITAVRDSGTTALAYFEIGSLENFRPDYQELRKKHDDLFLNEWPSWPGEYFGRYWDERWWDLVIKPRVDRALAAGFDGVYLDTPLAYEEIDLSYVPGMTRDQLGRQMVKLIERISHYAKAEQPNFLIFPQNSPELIRYAGFVDAIDGIGMEELFFLATDIPCDQPWCAENLKNARALRDAGKVVIAIDYASRPENIETACRRYREERFAGYVTTVDLDRIDPACPPESHHR